MTRIALILRDNNGDSISTVTLIRLMIQGIFSCYLFNEFILWLQSYTTAKFVRHKNYEDKLNLLATFFFHI